MLFVGAWVGGPGAALADPPPAPASPALARAREAWAKRAYEPSATAYQKALDDGGLSPDDVREAYVRMGTAFAAIGKSKPALDAFRTAATLDIDFTVPLDAPKRAISLAERAKREKRSMGKMAFAASIPSSVPAGQRFAVDATLDALHVPAVIRITISARDTLTRREFTHAELPATAVRLAVPVAMAMPDGAVDVRVDAIDLHSNRLATVEKRVRIAPAPAPSLSWAAAQDSQDAKGGGAAKDRGGGFWAGPWPWLIGGAIVAAGGASALYYFGFRQSDDVNVTGARVSPLR